MLILASTSETRAKILREFGVDFVQKSVGFDEESIVPSSPRDFVYQAANGKMKEAVKMFGLETPILCADTVVSVGDTILRKAKDESDARYLLGLQSGSNVSILTCTIYAKREFYYVDLSTTSYVFDRFDQFAIDDYIASGEWAGKAGAIMVEGFAKPYIQSTKGYESCAMGLGIEKLLGFLE